MLFVSNQSSVTICTHNLICRAILQYMATAEIHKATYWASNTIKHWISKPGQQQVSCICINISKSSFTSASSHVDIKSLTATSNRMKCRVVINRCLVSAPPHVNMLYCQHHLVSAWNETMLTRVSDVDIRRTYASLTRGDVATSWCWHKLMATSPLVNIIFSCQRHLVSTSSRVNIYSCRHHLVATSPCININSWQHRLVATSPRVNIIACQHPLMSTLR